jgi:hypothetical protein
VVDRGLEIVAITDHNTVAGVAAVRREVEWLSKLAETNRLTDVERTLLNRWRELSNQALVLPGFEFTATFGFHILAIFPPETPVRQLEHILLSLGVPPEKLDDGSTEVGASTDVLNAYRIIRQAGGLAIAAHANSTHGVAMRDFPFGGQTKIAYTQDPNLDALEVTDLDRRFRSTARFFNGSKPEYPRRMHCIQGSDAHRLTTDPKNPKRLGIGERTSELLLDEPSFEALRDLLRSSQFDRTRPARPKDRPFDPLEVAREEGPTIMQSFHETATSRGGRLTAVINDICGFANTLGGTVYVGASQRKGQPRGLAQPAQVEKEIVEALGQRMAPPLAIKFDVVQVEGSKVLRIQVPKGKDRPYCLDDNKFYVRNESETNLAVRDEIVALVREALAESGTGRQAGGRGGREAGQRTPRSQPKGGQERSQPTPGANGGAQPPPEPASPAPSVDATAGGATAGGTEDAFYLPQIGVEIVETAERQGMQFHSIRDLRNGHIIKNVTRTGARKLWSYAIAQHEDNPVDPAKIQWHGDIGLVHVEKRAGKVRYDLALRDSSGTRIFYGVTEDGMEGPWEALIQEE